MDDDALNMRNWGYYEPSFKGHLDLQLMSSMADRDIKPFIPNNLMADRDIKPFIPDNLMADRDIKPFIPNNLMADRDIKPFIPNNLMADRDIKPFIPNNLMVNHNAGFHPRDCMVSEPPIPMLYVRDTWTQAEKFFMPQPALNYAILPETSAAHSLPILQPPPPDSSTRGERLVDRVEELPASKEGVQSKKRQGGAEPKTPKAKKPRIPKDNMNPTVQRVKPAKKSMNIKINGYDMDISGIPVPVCSCTGAAQQCYRWGCGGWQSACCTTNVSMYPLPMSTKRRGARIAGRKMSQGAFKKVLEKLAAESYNFSNPIDLRSHWARHGTNKFVTIR